MVLYGESCDMDEADLSGDSGEEWFDEECAEEEDLQTTHCLFCSNQLDSPEKTWQHCMTEHGFNIKHMQRQCKFDDFGLIKLVNYCRMKKPTVPDLSVYTSGCDLPWSGDAYMKPVIDDDTLLTFDIEDLQIVDDTTGQSTSGNAGSNGGGDGGEDGRKMVTVEEHEDLLEQFKHAVDRAKLAEEQLTRLTQDLSKMKELAQTLVLSSTASAATPGQSSATPAIADLQENDDDLYFGSYSHFGIHQSMLQDKVRTESYRDSLYLNRASLEGKVVLDIGCGTGILSMFAAKAGAKKVIGIDMSDIAYQAMDIVRENKLSDVITILKGRVEDIELPVDEVDVIISEWMGYFLLFESMLDTVLYARDRWLKPGGVVLPNRCNISMVGLSDTELYDRHLAYWKDVYGFKMSCMRNAVVEEASVAVVSNEKVLTDAAQLTEIDINSCSISDLDFTSPFSLTAKEDGPITALVGYFDIWFDGLPNKVFFSTSPAATPTHWKQTVFLLEEPISLKKGESVSGQLICRKNRKDPRSLKITISIGEKRLTYHMQ